MRRCARRGFIVARRDGRRRMSASAKFSRLKNSRDARRVVQVVGPGHNLAFIRKRVYMPRESFQSRVRRRIIDARPAITPRANGPLITPHSRITAGRGKEDRRAVPAQYRGGVAAIMTDGGDVINGAALLLFYRDEVDHRVASASPFGRRGRGGGTLKPPRCAI